MKLRRCIPVFVITLSHAMVAGCLFSNNTAAVLWTDRPELAAYAELFNAQTNGRKIEAVYKETPWLTLERESEKPSLVVGTRLDSIEVIRNFRSLDGMIRRGRLNPSAFYSELFDMGRVGEKCFLVPVSFSLPAITFNSELGMTLPDKYVITSEQMRTMSGEFNIVEERPTKMGYSPRWQPGLIYKLSQLFGSGFSESDGGLPMWNEGKIEETLSFVIDWIQTTNGGYDLENVFEAKYMYDPLYKLLHTRRILFNFIRIERLLSVPAEVRENLDFRWLSDGKKIAVNDDVLFIGVPKQSRHTKTAEAFLSWLFTYETQVALLESSQFRRMRFFGIAGGLSSLVAVNTDAIPRFFPFLLGNIPHAGFLEFPDRLPKNWERMRDEVVIPWLADGVGEEKPSVTLRGNLAQWRLRHPELYR